MSEEQIIVQLNPDVPPTGSDLGVSYHGRIRQAYDRGYRVTLCGRAFGPKGELKIKAYGKQVYPTFSTNWGGRVHGIPLHKFAGYCFYGEKALKKGVGVRHLDANTLNLKITNLKLGSHSDNEQDKRPEDRSRVAKQARSAQGFTPNNAKLTPEDVRFIRKQYESLGGKKAPNGFTERLCKQFNVSRTVITKVVKKEYYPNV